MYHVTLDRSSTGFLSRLSKNLKSLKSISQMSEIETVLVTSIDLSALSIKIEELATFLAALTLRKVHDLLRTKSQYSIDDECILYRQKVCNPKRFQKKVFDKLFVMRNIDQVIEEAARYCLECANPKMQILKNTRCSREYLTAQWKRIYVDFSGPIFKHLFLIIVAASQSG